MNSFFTNIVNYFRKEKQTNSLFMRVGNKLRNQPVAVLCSRYHYRGILTNISEDGLVLSKARAVEISGGSQRECPEQEDKIDSNIFVNKHCIELIYQPNWCFASLDSDCDKYRNNI